MPGRCCGITRCTPQASCAFVRVCAARCGAQVMIARLCRPVDVRFDASGQFFAVAVGSPVVAVFQVRHRCHCLRSAALRAASHCATTSPPPLRRHGRHHHHVPLLPLSRSPPPAVPAPAPRRSWAPSARCSCCSRRRERALTGSGRSRRRRPHHAAQWSAWTGTALRACLWRGASRAPWLPCA